MKNLLLMRHGKSSWELNVNDEDRTLQQRGINDAHTIGQAIAAKKMNIDFAYSSPANRALHTAIICLRELNFPMIKFGVNNDLYDFSGEKAISFIRNTSDAYETILIFGHNHAFTYIANAMGSRHIANVPTSGFVHLQFQEDSWSKVTHGKTIQTLFPKEL